MKRSKSIYSIFLLVLFSIIFSHFLVIGYSKEVGITDGLVVKHTLTLSRMAGEIPTILTFTESTGSLFYVEWENKGDIDDTGSWYVNTDFRSVQNTENFGPSVGTHDPTWIYTDVSLNDQIMMCNFWKDAFTDNGDTVFNITGEAKFGSMDVWQLEDAYGSVVWYEKTRGFLVNGTIRYSTDWDKFEFESTNAFEKPGVPGFSYFILICIIAIGSIIIIKKQKIKK